MRSWLSFSRRSSPLRFLSLQPHIFLRDRLSSRYASHAAAASKLPISPEPAVEQHADEVAASFMEVMDLIKQDHNVNQSAWLRQRLRGNDLQIPSRSKVGENVIRFLFERRSYEQAGAVYQQMIEDGLLPSPSTDALFLAVALAVSKTSNEEQLEGFEAILSYRSFTEVHLMELLKHIDTLEISPRIAARLTRLFISVKAEGYWPSPNLVTKLIELHTRAGEIDMAARTIVEFEYQGGSRPTFENRTQPYAQILRTAPGTRSDQEAVDRIMGIMQEKDVPIHIAVFNSLIAREKLFRGLRKAFAFYSVIMRLAMTTPLKPDANTYQNLFRLLGFQYKNKYRQNASRRDQDKGIVVPPRLLFADMMSLCFSERFHPPRSDIPSVAQRQLETDRSLLLIAFRTFLYVDDYPAAIIALSTTIDLGLGVNERTYFVLLRYMARKVYFDIYIARLKKKNAPRFALELMGPFDHMTLDPNPHKAYRWIMERLIEHNSVRRTAVATVIASQSGRIPTVDEILNQHNHVSGDQLDEFPLINILRRGMRAQIALRHSEKDQPKGNDERKRAVRKVKYQMIPKDVPLWTWKGKHETTRQRSYRKNH
ncbi:unnamed protein product [Mycena citricolor]|uniref:Uncharacterized protein n=1 Tax=Mycena citricolor TaxID=2018698 RepID=A0AAD2HNW4_9AGAR|nr:unnamed protein product [Mycena citricolor]